MIRDFALLPVAVLFCTSSTPLEAESVCAGTLRDYQRDGFVKLFPSDYSPSLTNVGRATAPDHVKRLTPSDAKRLSASTPTVVTRAKLSLAHPNMLKSWLNENATDSIPGWFATALGVLVPSAWVGLTADASIQLMNASGDAGRMKLANLAGTVSEGGTVAVTEQVAKDAKGSLKFLWSYVYQANLNGKLITTRLRICSADAVVIE